MGMDFQMSMDFIHVSLRKWLPRMNEFQRQNVAASIYDSLDSLRKAGKLRICSGTHISSSCAGCIINLNAL